MSSEGSNPSDELGYHASVDHAPADDVAIAARRPSVTEGPIVRTLSLAGSVLDWSFRTIVVAIHVFLLGVVLMGVFYRYALDNPIAWSDTVSGWLFAAMVMIAAVIGVRRKTHIMIDILHDKLPRPLQLVIEVMYYLGFVMVGIILLYSGIKLRQLMGDRKALNVDIALSVPMAVIPIGGALFVLEALRGLVGMALGVEPEPPDADEAATAGAVV